jgi:hypothetical protein
MNLQPGGAGARSLRLSRPILFGERKSVHEADVLAITRIETHHSHNQYYGKCAAG